MLFAQGWQFSVEVDGLEGAVSLPKILPTTITASNMKRLKRRREYPSANGAFAWADNDDGRDTVDGLVLDWFKTAKSRVTIRTVPGIYRLNICSMCVFIVAVLRFNQTGKWDDGIPGHYGDVTYARDQVTEFKSFPMTSHCTARLTNPQVLWLPFWALLFSLN